MPMQLLPKSAAAFAPRAPPNIVLNTRVEPWLTQAIKRVNRVKRTLNNPQQHHRVLAELLGGAEAIWTLAAMHLPKAPKPDLLEDDDPLMEAMHNYNLLHIQAYVVHIDMVSQHEVAFKLTPDTIDALIKYHKDIFCVDAAASVFDWPEKDAEIKKLQEDFKQAVNRFVFRTNIRALDGLEEGGAGELLEGRADSVKSAVTQLFAPLLPPPPRIVDVVHPASVLTPTGFVAGWWQPTGFLTPSCPPSLDTWRVLPSTPSPTSTTCSDSQLHSWPTTSMALDLTQLPSPTPSIDQTVFSAAASLYSSPQALSIMPPVFYPSQLPHSCASMATNGGMNGTGLGYHAFAAPQYATTM